MFQYLFSFFSGIFQDSFIDIMVDFVYLTVFVLLINYLFFIVRGGRKSG